jgi:hypothetical protein
VVKIRMARLWVAKPISRVRDRAPDRQPTEGAVNRGAHRLGSRSA